MATRVTHKLVTKTSPMWQRLKGAHATLKGGVSLKVGFIGDGPGGEEHQGEDGGDGISNARLAAVHEYGYPEGHIPERPFMAPSWEANAGRYQDAAEKIMRGVAAGTLDLERGLGALGALIASDIRSYVTTGPPIPPPNAPATLERKQALSSGAAGPVRTLIDTGRLMQSITWAIVYS